MEVNWCFSNIDLTRKVESNRICHDDPLVSGIFWKAYHQDWCDGPKVVSAALAVDLCEVSLLGTWSNLIFCLRHKPINWSKWKRFLPSLFCLQVLHTKEWAGYWSMLCRSSHLKCRVGRQRAIKLKAHSNSICKLTRRPFHPHIDATNLFGLGWKGVPSPKARAPSKVLNLCLPKIKILGKS